MKGHRFAGPKTTERRTAEELVRVYVNIQDAELRKQQLHYGLRGRLQYGPEDEIILFELRLKTVFCANGEHYILLSISLLRNVEILQ